MRLTGCRKGYFVIFTFFIVSNFKWLLLKILWTNHSFLWWISRVLMKFCYVKNIFDLHTFHNETTALLKRSFSTEMHFVSFFFLNERNITTSVLIIQLTCAVVHYANLNSSSINKSYLQAVEYSISFFSISYLYLKKLLF